MKDTELEKVDTFKDLGVLFDVYLLFDSHISEKVSKAYMMLGIIKRNFDGATVNPSIHPSTFISGNEAHKIAYKICIRLWLGLT